MIQLRSDFRDWYDFGFDRCGMVFERYSAGGMARGEALQFMAGLGLRVPRYGMAREIIPSLLADISTDFRQLAANHLVDCVVYLDERSHCGEGKIRVSASEAMANYPDLLCAEYLPATPSGNGRSLRYLQIGDRKWWIEYRSADDWRSNAGEVTTTVLAEEERGYHPHIALPLFAFDFIPAADGLYAVDYNTAPGCAPLNGLVRASEICQLLENAMLRQAAAKES